MEELVGKPRSHWIGDQWIPAEGSKLYTTDEIRSMFQQECTLFVGDSLQRRAGDTLHLMLTTTDELHTPDVPNAAFPSEIFSQGRQPDRSFRRNDISSSKSRSLTTSSTPDHHSSPGSRRTGCVDIEWRPRFEDIKAFANDFRNQTNFYKDYTVVVVGVTTWDLSDNESATNIRHRVNETIYQLRDLIPRSVLVVWKSSGWCANCGWTPDEETERAEDNYKIFAANDQARKTINASLRADTTRSNLLFLDWAREVLPRSFGKNRLGSKDGSAYHYGLQPRVQFLQMLTEVYDKKKHGALVVGTPALESRQQQLLTGAHFPSFVCGIPSLPLAIGTLVTLFLMSSRRQRKRRSGCK